VIETEGPEFKRHNRRSFMVAAVAAAGGLAGFQWLRTRRDDNGALWPLRRMLEVNEQIWRDFFRKSREAPVFARSLAAPEPRLNGDIGLKSDMDVAAWKLHVSGDRENGMDADLTLDQIKSLPKREMVTELKCIEGWSQIIEWAGARFSDFAAQYGPPTMTGYVGMETPDRGYYVGLDSDSALHPQTLLCYEMNGKPLTLEHGAPLRLVIPVKYGIKNIKRIGSIHFTNRRPDDYWAEQGYDWYAGH
jgi:DMSO/TMAO reductase YedYZ molybdopterin-dependent catalytic subunit